MSGTGMMDPAFFVGKNTILKWLNETFSFGYTKIEQTCTGAAHCQILDALYPGKVPLHKVNFDANKDYEYVANYKVLQSAFDSENITKHIDVAKLIKGKYQDNLEFCQWIKKFFDDRYNVNSGYNAVERREQAKQQYKKGHKHAGASKIGSVSAAPVKTVTNTVSAVKPAAASVAKTTPTAKRVVSHSGAVKPASSAKPVSKPTTPSKVGASVAAAHADEVNKLTVTLETMQKERDFYFGKLREIEILCQNDDTDPTVQGVQKKILDILYHSDEPDFQSPVEDASSMAEIENGTSELAVTDENKEADDGLLAL